MYSAILPHSFSIIQRCLPGKKDEISLSFCQRHLLHCYVLKVTLMIPEVGRLSMGIVQEAVGEVCQWQGYDPRSSRFGSDQADRRAGRPIRPHPVE